MLSSPLSADIHRGDPGCLSAKLFEGEVPPHQLGLRLALQDHGASVEVPEHSCDLLSEVVVSVVGFNIQCRIIIGFREGTSSPLGDLDLAAVHLRDHSRHCARIVVHKRVVDVGL